ncbi:S-adenosyl-L-methionine-dependent methyltransferase [Astrocystis sublimbata]|nr:S-adenosyl-L-methionine-dependent methyltransferase [Astrocystis sublimbata]
MSSPEPDAFEAEASPPHVDIATVLEGLAAFDGQIPPDIKTNDDLRRRILGSVQKLVAELETPAETAQRLLYNELELCAARIGVDLNIFTILSSSSTTTTRPLTTAEIATQTGANPDLNLLSRILRYMASVSMIAEAGPGLWAQRNYGANLTDKRQCAGICHVHDSVIPAYLALPGFLRANKYQLPPSNTDTPFARGHKVEAEAPPTTFFKWLETHPANAQYFHEFMNVHRTGVRTWMDDEVIFDKIGKVLYGNDHPGADLFVDVGGGLGQQCKLLKSRYPDLQGRIILEDLPEVVEKIDPKETDFEIIGMDFFLGQPIKGAAIYYLRSIFRNWPPPQSIQILTHIHAAMCASSLLIIDDVVVPDVSAHKFETQLDLTMLAMLNGQARTRGDWVELLAQSGFVVVDEDEDEDGGGDGIRVYEEEAREALIIARKCTSS